MTPGIRSHEKERSFGARAGFSDEDLRWPSAGFVEAALATGAAAVVAFGGRRVVDTGRVTAADEVGVTSLAAGAAEGCPARTRLVPLGVIVSPAGRVLLVDPARASPTRPLCDEPAEDDRFGWSDEPAVEERSEKADECEGA